MATRYLVYDAGLLIVETLESSALKAEKIVETTERPRRSMTMKLTCPGPYLLAGGFPSVPVGMVVTRAVWPVPLPAP